jgi:hypothetical protein
MQTKVHSKFLRLLLLVQMLFENWTQRASARASWQCEISLNRKWSWRVNWFRKSSTTSLRLQTDCWTHRSEKVTSSSNPPFLLSARQEAGYSMNESWVVHARISRLESAKCVLWERTDKLARQIFERRLSDLLRAKVKSPPQWHLWNRGRYSLLSRGGFAEMWTNHRRDLGRIEFEF